MIRIPQFGGQKDLVFGIVGATMIGSSSIGGSSSMAIVTIRLAAAGGGSSRIRTRGTIPRMVLAIAMQVPVVNGLPDQVFVPVGFFRCRIHQAVPDGFHRVRHRLVGSLARECDPQSDPRHGTAVVQCQQVAMDSSIEIGIIGIIGIIGGSIIGCRCCRRHR